jgi:hypothetical protein
MSDPQQEGAGAAVTSPAVEAAVAPTRAGESSAPGSATAAVPSPSSGQAPEGVARASLPQAAAVSASPRGPEKKSDPGRARGKPAALATTASSSGDAPNPAAGTKSNPPLSRDDPMVAALARPAPGGESVGGGKGLSAALAKCAGEKFLDGFVCEQKMRMQYCEGKWDTTSECSLPKREAR